MAEPEDKTPEEPEDATDAAPARSEPALDPTEIRIETKALAVDLLVRRMAEGGIELSPDEPSSPPWDSPAQSRLIESLLLRVPLPAFYFDASAPGGWRVIDGLNRLAALDAFVNGGAFALAELEFLDHLAGKGFAELPRHFQRRILDTKVTAHLIQEGTPEAVRTAIARRIKAGGRAESGPDT